MLNQLTTQMGAKQMRENRIINVVVVSKETGIPRQTLYNWIDGNVTRFDVSIIVRLCKYFNCGVGDLIVYVPDEDDEELPTPN